MAEFGKQRFQSGVAYLGTLRADGSPRIHPVTPIVSERLFLFMEPTSPKEHYILLILELDSAFMNVYTDDGPNGRRWPER